MVRISSITPEDDEGKRTPIPKITWNNKTEESYKEQGFCPEQGKDDDFYYEEPPRINLEEKRFLSEVDTKRLRTRILSSPTEKKDKIVISQ